MRSDHQAIGIVRGVRSIVSGVLDIKKSVSRQTFIGGIIAFVLIGGGISDRSMGFPVLRWALSPIRVEQAARDSVIRSEIKAELKAEISPLSAKLDTLIPLVNETRDVVERIARHTGTQRRIRREMEEERRPRGLFGNAPPSTSNTWTAYEEWTR